MFCVPVAHLNTEKVVVVIISSQLGSGDDETPVHAIVHLSCFHINLYISFIYEDIFTKYAENVYV